MIVHDSFTLNREVKAPVAEVFAAWTDPTDKQTWFADGAGTYELDFRTGGSEVIVSGDIAFRSTFHTVEDEQLIAFASVLSQGQQACTLSITTVEFRPGQEGTTELELRQSNAFLTELESPQSRRAGNETQLDALQDLVAGRS